MKIAFYAPLKPPTHPVPSGDRRMARLLMRALKAAGHEVRLASRLRAYDRAGDADSQSKIRQRAETLARRFSQNHQPDIWFTYHLYHKAPDWIGPQVARHLGIPYVVAEASYAPKQAGGPWASGHDQVAHALAQADLVLHLNPADRECVGPLLKPGCRQVDLPPFLDPAPHARARHMRAETRAALAAKWGIDPAKPWVITAAMMRPDKAKLPSYRLLAGAMAALGDLPHEHLILGSGAAEAEIRQAFAACPHSHFLGLCDPAETARILAAGDIFAWPALNEAYGLAALEAQASGLPVVAGHTPGLANMVCDGESGLLCTNGDQADFTAALARLLTDGDLRRAMSRAALEKLAERHTIACATTLIEGCLPR